MNSSWNADGEDVGRGVAEADHSHRSLVPKHSGSTYHSAEFTRLALEKVDEWNEYIRALVRSQGREADLLELPVGSGWEPLCEFLGVDVPRDERGDKEKYPMVRTGGEMRSTALKVWRVCVIRAIATLTVPVGLVSAMYWYWR